MKELERIYKQQQNSHIFDTPGEDHGPTRTLPPPLIKTPRRPSRTITPHTTPLIAPLRQLIPPRRRKQQRACLTPWQHIQHTKSPVLHVNTGDAVVPPLREVVADVWVDGLRLTRAFVVGVLAVGDRVKDGAALVEDGERGAGGYSAGELRSGGGEEGEGEEEEEGRGLEVHSLGLGNVVQRTWALVKREKVGWHPFLVWCSRDARGI